MTVHRGESVAPGTAVGPVRLRGYDEQATFGQRIAADQVENELNRLREALQKSRAQIEEIKHKQQANLGEAELRIFDAHVAYLADPMFVTEIENQVLQERFGVRDAVRLVFEKYDRIFQLVESELLRRRASDLRDVATRLQRNLVAVERAPAQPPVAPGPYILAARKLTTADMFNLENEQVDGIVAEEGGMSSHAAILARGMGIPTITGIRDLPRLLRDGDLVVLDAGRGELLTAPDEAQLQEFTRASQRWKATRVQAPEEGARHATRDGTAIRLLGACGSVGEVELSRTFGLTGVGLFRTELPFLVDKSTPTEEVLLHQYNEVLRQPAGGTVNFRLLDVAADTLNPGQRPPERNPALGMRGVRGLLQNQQVLRRQIRAILRAAAGHDGTGLLVPFVTSIADLQRVKAAVLEERLQLRKAKVPCADQLRLAPVIEVPAAALVVGSLLQDSDFAVVAVDDLQAHLLAADRDNAAVREYQDLVHPALFEILARMAKEAERRDQELVLFGEGAADPVRVPFYLGAGYRSFAVAPVRLRAILRVLRRYSLEECRRIAARILEAPRTTDVQKVLVGIDTS
ncbi:MAG TPA: phosphoenolpyruvate--protein phosphotransferase [Planctomycetota bacterium]|nr:phosphoenolpyruvate--protein phosphotransferase [Planctomycetota bacterium]